jgi:hypothetical protein
MRFNEPMRVPKGITGPKCINALAATLDTKGEVGLPYLLWVSGR